MKHLILLLSLCCSALLTAQQFEAHYHQKEGKTLPYLLLKPLNFDSSQSYPLLIFLHGAGERGSDNKVAAKHFSSLVLADSNRINYPAFVIIPQCDTGYRWVEVDWKLDSHQMPAEPSLYMSLFLEVLDSLEQSPLIDKNRIYVSGLSMGGFGTWDLIARFPNRFAAAAPVCGGADLNTAPQIAHIPIWTFHGAKDRLVKPSRSREMVDALKKINGNIKYTEYPDLGHDSWKAAYAEPDFLTWIFGWRLDK